jgi:hypothetical protein
VPHFARRRKRRRAKWLKSNILFPDFNSEYIAAFRRNGAIGSVHMPVGARTDTRPYADSAVLEIVRPEIDFPGDLSSPR